MERIPPTKKEYKIEYSTNRLPIKRPITENNLTSPPPNALRKKSGNKRIKGMTQPAIPSRNPFPLPSAIQKITPSNNPTNIRPFLTL